MFTKLLENYVDYDNAAGGHLKKGTANTALTNHAKKIFALHEGSLPFGIKVEKDNFDIKSLDYDDFNGACIKEFDVSSVVSICHPKIDPETGELHNLSYNLEHNVVIYYRFDKDRKLTNKIEVELVNPRFVHDM